MTNYLPHPMVSNKKPRTMPGLCLIKVLRSVLVGKAEQRGVSLDTHLRIKAHEWRRRQSICDVAEIGIAIFNACKPVVWQRRFHPSTNRPASFGRRRRFVDN